MGSLPTEMVACGQATTSVGQLNAQSPAWRDMRLIPEGDGGYPFVCTTCPPCARTIAAGVAECPMRDTRIYYMGPPGPKACRLSALRLLRTDTIPYASWDIDRRCTEIDARRASLGQLHRDRRASPVMSSRASGVGLRHKRHVQVRF